VRSRREDIFSFFCPFSLFGRVPVAGDPGFPLLVHGSRGDRSGLSFSPFFLFWALQAVSVFPIYLVRTALAEERAALFFSPRRRRNVFLVFSIPEGFLSLRLLFSLGGDCSRAYSDWPAVSKKSSFFSPLPVFFVFFRSILRLENCLLFQTT